MVVHDKLVPPTSSKGEAIPQKKFFVKKKKKH